MENKQPVMVEGWSEGFLRDDQAKQFEPHQRPYQFLYTGRKPQVGQRAIAQLSLANSRRWCEFTGIVTEVGELPTFDQWVSSPCL